MKLTQLNNFLNLQQSLHGFSDLTNQLMITQAAYLMDVGYEVTCYPERHWFYGKEGEIFLSLDFFSRCVFQSPEMFCLGVFKYFCAGDLYEITITSKDQVSVHILSLSEKDNKIQLPSDFNLYFPCTVKFKVVQFGGNNLASLNQIMKLDYDQEARDICQNFAVEDFTSSLPFVLKDNNFLRKIPKPYNLSKNSLIIYFSEYIKEYGRYHTFLAQLTHAMNKQNPLIFRYSSSEITFLTPQIDYLSFTIFRKQMTKSMQFLYYILPFKRK